MKSPLARPDVPEIVAHRGDAEHFPGITLPALESAWRHGLAYAEFDVQLAPDGIPYVIHDASLERTAGVAGDLRLMTSGQLDGIDAGEPARFGTRHGGVHLPRGIFLGALTAGYVANAISYSAAFVIAISIILSSLIMFTIYLKYRLSHRIV